MLDKDRVLRTTPIFGILGVVSIASGIAISAIAYQGRNAESYSFLNHFVSELGEKAHSELAAAFNLGLILGGILLLAFLLGVATSIGGWFGWILGIVGLVSSISGTLVGFFPMDNLGPHFLAAMVFFYAGLVITLLFSLFVLFLDQRNLFKKWMSVPGLISGAAFFYFLFLTDPILPEGASLESLSALLENRPQFLESAVFEWVVVIALLGWITSLSIYMRSNFYTLTRKTETSPIKNN